MAKILFLSHRIPFPPNKGEKIRAYHILRHLVARHEVRLGAVADTILDLGPIAELSLFKEIHFAHRGAIEAGLALARAVVTGGALSVSLFSSRDLRRWVALELSATKPDIVYVFSSPMAQYVLGCMPPGARLILDFVDMDSEKFRQYAALRRGPMRIVYEREARSLLHFDRAAAQAADACLFVSRSERQLFVNACPEAADRVHVVPNGVDSDYFNPSTAPSAANAQPTIVFTGRMDYLPNIDAVTWFATSILPLVRQQVPHAKFQIVGSAPTKAVRALAAADSVEVTGAVEDVRPYYAAASVAVAPLRIARGIQNKVLEGMAMAKPMVVTPEALDGIEAVSGEHVLVATDAAEFARAVLAALDRRDLGARAREVVLARHSWATHLAQLDAILSGLSQS